MTCHLHPTTTKFLSIGSIGDSRVGRDVQRRNDDHFREGNNHENANVPFTNASATQLSPSRDCNLCIIEAPGGVSLVYWAPDDANGVSGGNGTVKDNPDIPHTLVEDGFTL